MAKFKVMKTDGDNPRGGKTQCGAAVKTVAKANDLKARMQAQQQRGSSNGFTIERA